MTTPRSDLHFTVTPSGKTVPEMANELERARKILATMTARMWCCGDGHREMCIGCHQVMEGNKPYRHAEGCFVARAQEWLKESSA